jgi:hypothetical protein
MGKKGQRDTRPNAMKSGPLPWLSLCLCLTAFLGCGYTVANTTLSSDYRTLAIPAFKNESFEQEVQIRVSNALVRELEADGRFRIVDDPASADLVLKGAITDFDARAISFSTDDNIGQFKITLFAKAALEDTRTGQVIWEQDNLQGTDFYETQGGRTREEALDEATENLVETIIYECFESSW